MDVVGLKAQLLDLCGDLTHYRFDAWREDVNVGLSVSGGLSSAYQAAHIVAAHRGIVPRFMRPHFCNTGKESAETLDFVDTLDRVLGLGLAWLEYDSNSPTKVRVVDFATASRDGRPFNEFLYDEITRKDKTVGVRPLPNAAQRTCTDQLKAKTWHRYARRHLGWSTKYYTVLGYRADEPNRYLKRLKRDRNGFKETGKGLFPAYFAGVTTDIKEDFWRAAPFTLAHSSDHGNCDYCFMVSTWKIKERMLMEALSAGTGLRKDNPPPRLRFWIAAEERVSDRPGVFRKDRPTYRVLWNQVCEGNMQSAVPENVEDRCQSCTD